jgi:hypothetical protein
MIHRNQAGHTLSVSTSDNALSTAITIYTSAIVRNGTIESANFAAREEYSEF